MNEIMLLMNHIRKFAFRTCWAVSACLSLRTLAASFPTSFLLGNFSLSLSPRRFHQLYICISTSLVLWLHSTSHSSFSFRIFPLPGLEILTLIDACLHGWFRQSLPDGHARLDDWDLCWSGINAKALLHAVSGWAAQFDSTKVEIYRPWLNHLGSCLSFYPIKAN